MVAMVAVMVLVMVLVQVVDRLSGQPVCGPDTQGELCVRTPQLLLSYRCSVVSYGRVGTLHFCSPAENEDKKCSPRCVS